MASKKAQAIAVVEVTRPNSQSPEGLGFIVAGRFVITAAHNLAPPDSSSGLYDDEVVPVRIRDKDWNEMTPVFIDRCTDCAVLFPHDEDGEFANTLAKISPLPLSWCPLMGRKQGGALFMHDKGLVPATYDVSQSHMVNFVVGSPIASGTSGGPVFDRTGALLALVSHSTSDRGHQGGYGPAIGQCLPVWLARRIAEWESRDFGMPNGVKPIEIPSPVAAE